MSQRVRKTFSNKNFKIKKINYVDLLAIKKHWDNIRSKEPFNSELAYKGPLELDMKNDNPTENMKVHGVRSIPILVTDLNGEKYNRIKNDVFNISESSVIIPRNNKKNDDENKINIPSSVKFCFELISTNFSNPELLEDDIDTEAQKRAGLFFSHLDDEEFFKKVDEQIILIKKEIIKHEVDYWLCNEIVLLLNNEHTLTEVCKYKLKSDHTITSSLQLDEEYDENIAVTTKTS